MNNILVVTTFHEPGLVSYGQRMLDTFAKNVDKRIRLVCYAEDCDPVNPDPQQITIINQKHLDQLLKFKETLSTASAMGLASRLGPRMKRNMKEISRMVKSTHWMENPER